MKPNLSPRSRQLLTVGLFATVLAGLLAVTHPQPSLAQRKVVPTPTGVRWCGIADTGGAMRMEVSPDLKYVYYIEIQTASGLLSTNEGFNLSKQQIADKQFIFRRTDQQRQCTPGRTQPAPRNPCRIAPCREEPPCRVAPCNPQDCPVVQTETLTIRGKFQVEDTVKGTYTGILNDLSDIRDRRNAPPRQTRVTGSFIGWPESVAPCQ